MPNFNTKPFDHTLPPKMHALYNELTGLRIEWGFNRLYPWECFCVRFTEEDLRVVVRWIQKRQRDGKSCRSLAFRSLIAGPGSLDYFEEDLAQARLEMNNKKPKPNQSRDSVLRATGREPESAPAKPIASLTPKSEAEMREFCERLKRENGLI